MSKKILIVEDDLVLQNSLDEFLKAEGFETIVAIDGEIGVQKALTEKPDLILLDIMMPKMNGIEMAQQMKLKGVTTPIIFLTNMGDVEHMSKAIETIQSDYIIKSDVPVDQIIVQVKKKLGIV